MPVLFALAVFSLCFLAPASLHAQLVKWVQRNPDPRSGHAMAYDSARAVTVRFGGVDGASINADTAEWTVGSWTQRDVAGPSARQSHAMAYDATRNVTVLFGGFNANVNTFNADTWELCSATITAQTAAQAVCPRHPATFTITAVGSNPFTYQWRKNAVAIDTAANPTAATTTLTLTRVGPADAASYDCIVSNRSGNVTSNPAELALGGPNCCAADFNADDTLDPDDLADFITSYFTIPSAPDSDFNADGTTDPNDLADYIAAFFSSPC